MFKELSPSERDDVFDLFTSVYVPVGRVLIEQGAKADRFFFIVTGRLEVSKDQEFVRHLGPGQFVGEIGLLKKSQRLAKVVTLTDCHLLECHSEIFDEMIERFPLIRRHLEEVAENRAQGLYISDPLLID